PSAPPWRSRSARARRADGPGWRGPRRACRPRSRSLCGPNLRLDGLPLADTGADQLGPLVDDHTAAEDAAGDRGIALHHAAVQEHRALDGRPGRDPAVAADDAGGPQVRISRYVASRPDQDRLV